MFEALIALACLPPSEALRRFPGQEITFTQERYARAHQERLKRVRQEFYDRGRGAWYEAAVEETGFRVRYWTALSGAHCTTDASSRRQRLYYLWNVIGCERFCLGWRPDLLPDDSDYPAEPAPVMPPADIQIGANR